jgi:hypothetical protein
VRRWIAIGLIALATIVLFDVAVWYVMPREQTAGWCQYRKPADLPPGRYPQNYFAPHPDRGFDITPGRSAEHYVHELGRYPVWSNRWGCFDREHDTAALQNGYVYLAGDSFTWGYARFEEHFAQTLSAHSAMPVLRCGVTNTGQRHQFAKFLEVSTAIGRAPNLVVVNYVANDMADDYAFPSTTVVNGWKVPRYELDANDDVVPISADDIRARLDAALTPPQRNWRQKAGNTLRRYSAAGNIALAALGKGTGCPRPTAQGTGARVASAPPERRGTWQLFGSQETYPWHNPRWSAANRSALLDWQAHANAQGYVLVVSLIGYAQTGDIAGYFRALREDLRQQGVHVIDSSPELAATPRPQAYFFPTDGHFNAEGQQFYAAFLLRELPPFGFRLRASGDHR